MESPIGSRRTDGPERDGFPCKGNGNQWEMAREEILVDVSPDRVFEVLADPDRYADWVVGAADVRGADDEWPAPGSELHHTQGVGPFTLKDETIVLEAERPSRLVLLAEIEPLGKMRITVELEEEGQGTRVTLTEEPESGAVETADNPLSDWLLGKRNTVALQRLKRIAETA